jgi:uncharacterized cupredoxin-like copper-binding protein
MIFGAGQALWLAIVTVVSVAALVLAGLALWTGGGGGGTATSSPGTSDQVRVVAADFSFDPPEARVPAGQEVDVELVNDGAVEHNWSVLREPIASEDELTDDAVLAAIDTVQPGESGAGTFTFDAGEYQLVCTIPGHFESGMEGTLVAQ